VTDYRQIKAINWSTLKWMRESPAHYRYWLEHPVETTPSMRMGIAVHCAILEPEKFAATYITYPGRRAGKDWDAFEAANLDKEILKTDEHETALQIAAAVRRHPVANHLLEIGEAEKTMTWTDEKTGLPCKGRLDWLNGIGLVDLKTSFDISPWKFNSTAARQGYHGQLAFYRRGLLAQGLDAPAKILAVETEPPFDVMVYSLDEDAMWAGDQLVDALLAKVKHCMKTNVWPGRAAEEVPLQLPGWAWTGAEVPADDAINDLVIRSGQ
jgi:hypothetical protein